MLLALGGEETERYYDVYTQSSLSARESLLYLELR